MPEHVAVALADERENALVHIESAAAGEANPHAWGGARSDAHSVS
jgi:hypothetical protein